MYRLRGQGTVLVLLTCRLKKISFSIILTCHLKKISFSIILTCHLKKISFSIILTCRLKKISFSIILTCRPGKIPFFSPPGREDVEIQVDRPTEVGLRLSRVVERSNSTAKTRQYHCTAAVELRYYETALTQIHVGKEGFLQLTRICICICIDQLICTRNVSVSMVPICYQTFTTGKNVPISYCITVQPHNNITLLLFKNDQALVSSRQTRICPYNALVQRSKYVQ